MSQQTLTHTDRAKQIGLAPLQHNPVPLAVRARLKHRLLGADSVSELMQNFYDSIREQIPLDGLSYEHPDMDQHWSAGVPGTHHASYHLNAADGDHGSLRFSRCRDRFSETELEQLEVMMGTLIYPLKIVTLLQRSNAAQPRHQRSELAADNNDRLHLQLDARCNTDAANQSALLLLEIDALDCLRQELSAQDMETLMLKVRTRINACLQAQDQVFSLGSRQVAILLGHTSRTRTHLVAELLLLKLSREAFRFGAIEARITASIGAATLETEDTAHKVLDRAEIGLMMARHSGGAQVRYVDTGVIESARERQPCRLPVRAAS